MRKLLILGLIWCTSAFGAGQLTITSLSPLTLEKPCTGFTVVKSSPGVLIKCGTVIWMQVPCSGTASIVNYTTYYSIRCNGITTLKVTK